MAFTMPGLTVGRALITIGNLGYSFGAFAADWSDTHVKNPRWPPHAKFHNGQTMSLGVLLAATSSYFLFRRAPNLAAFKDNTFNAALIGTFYCGSGLSAILYPGTAWQDPEFRGAGEQRYIFAAICAMMWIGYGLERRRLGLIKKAFSA